MDKETKQYCVTVRLYTFAKDKETALSHVTSDLDYLCEMGDNAINGYINPELSDVEEDKEI